MNVDFIRPSVSDLMLHMFERPLHPELFEVCREETIAQPDYRAQIRICDSGHVVTFQTGETVLSELVTRRGHPLPERKERLHRPLKGCRDESVELDGPIRYHVSFQVERLAPEVFLTLHEELLIDCQNAPIAHSFGSANRLAPAALSFMQTDVWTHSLLVHAFHTFPEDCAIVKTQSLFEM
ncbi:MAG: DUF2617 family protein [Planctomycetota bacterium]|jgi:hypothetical protein